MKKSEAQQQAMVMWMTLSPVDRLRRQPAAVPTGKWTDIVELGDWQPSLEDVAQILCKNSDEG